MAWTPNRCFNVQLFEPWLQLLNVLIYLELIAQVSLQVLH